MFTVKHCRPDGTEFLWHAVNVEYIPMVPGVPGAPHVNMLCGPDEAGPGIGAQALYDGTVYVMNRYGKTVADYSLSVTPNCT